MKKTYVKPELSFESFELSASIATGCGMITKNSADIINCYFDDGISRIFDVSETGHACNHGPDESGKVCYDNSSDASMLFTS